MLRLDIDFASELERLNTDLNDLRRAVRNAEWQENLLKYIEVNLNCIKDEMVLRLGSYLNDDELRVSNTRTRQFEFTAMIISLYGALEYFVETCISTLLDAFKRAALDYKSLPDAIRTTHLQLSYELSARLESGRFKGQISVDQIIKNLYSCTLPGEEYTLNKFAYLSHSSNFRLKSINEYFTRIGFSNCAGRALTHRKMEELVATKFMEYGASYVLDDLAERRNYVAHGRSSELLSRALQLDYIDYIENFCECLAFMLRNDWARFLISISNSALGHPAKIYNRHIVCFTNLAISATKGDILIGRSPDGWCLAATIGEIQVNNKSINAIASIGPEGVAFGTNGKFKDNYEFFLVCLNFKSRFQSLSPDAAQSPPAPSPL